MIGISQHRSLAFGREKGPSSPAKEHLNARLLFTNVVLAFLVLLASGFVSALAKPLAGS